MAAAHQVDYARRATPVATYGGGTLRTGRAGPSLLRLREIAASVGISERRAHDIVVDLTTSGYLAKQCEERRNTREVQSHGRSATISPTTAPSVTCWRS